MGVDIVDLVSRESSVVQGCLHRSGRANALFVRCGNVKSIAARAVANDLGIDVSTARSCVVQTLKDHNPSPLTDDKPVPVGVKGAASPQGIVIAT